MLKIMSPYLPPDYDPLKKKVEEVVDERCFYNWEIARIVHHLGRPELQSLDESVLKSRIDAELRSKKRSEKKKAGIYRSVDVFEYLQKLAASNQINLNYETMDEIIQEGLHMKHIGMGLIF